MTDTIFQPSDLAGVKRTEFLDAARRGLARLRDKDGTSLVMLPESKLELVQTLARWGEAYAKLDNLLRRSSPPTANELGELAWLRPFDRDDLQEFLSELRDALIASSADEDTSALDNCLRAWRVTARQMEDPLRRAVLLGEHRSDDYEEVYRPHDGN
ncbi:MAG TPA: hypothetical protein VF069_23995 [Streptosporangiaceae bacterium]